nr:hypothetical protein [Marseillevirus cajuinensis]
MNLPLIFAFFIVVSLLIVWFFFARTKKQEPPPKNKEPFQVVSCGCPELATSHPGRVEHKMRCSVFRSLNPELTMKKFLEFEGFPTDKDIEWPKL